MVEYRTLVGSWLLGSPGAAGTAVRLDLGNDDSSGAHDSAGLIKIATAGDTNGIFSAPASDVLLVDLTQAWPQTTISLGASGATAATTADELVVQDNADAGMSILTPSANISRIYLGTNLDATSALIQWSHTDDEMTVGTQFTGGEVVFTSGNGTEALRLTTAQQATFAGQVNISTQLSLSSAPISTNLTTEDEGFLNFQATADADTTSAISTLTTSGAVSHHIQVKINGVKAWIPASTTNPS